MNFHQKLTLLLRGQNLAEFARESGVPRSALSRILTFTDPARADVAVKLASALGVSIEWLLNDKYGMPAVAASVIDSAIAIEQARRAKARDLLHRAFAPTPTPMRITDGGVSA